MMSIEDIVDILSLDLIGVIPDDENVVVAANQGESLTGYHTPMRISADVSWEKMFPWPVTLEEKAFSSGLRII